MKIKTSILQSLVARSVKGASMNKMLPITSIMAIRLDSNVLTLMTTDGTNYLYVTENKVAGDDFYVAVQADVFAKLIARLTCEFVELVITYSDTHTASGLTVKGNGTYRLDIPLDEDGNMIKFPMMVSPSCDVVDSGTINLSTMRYILLTAKSALDTTGEIECYTGYYCGDSVIATDTEKICMVDVTLFNSPMLIRSEAFDLVDLLTDEVINYVADKDVIVFSSDSGVVYSPLMPSIDDYQINAINSFVDISMGSKCSVPKSALLQLLDRLSLFVSPYDKNVIYLTFTNEGLQVDSKQANSVELISYSMSSNYSSFTCCVDIEALRSQVKSVSGDVITICYGDESTIQIVNDNTVKVLALQDDDRIQED